MGRLVVVEGLDGSGKATLTSRLQATANARGQRVTTLAFPRYGDSVFADLVRETLYGKLGDLADSVYGPALLFALDRRDAASRIRELLADNDIVLLDRYVSSNAAYGAARLGGPAVDAGFPEWVQALEVERFGVPTPDLQILLDVPAALAERRALHRAAVVEDRALDTFEADGGLQRRTAAMYVQLAASGYLSRWHVLRPDEAGQLDVPPDLLES